jgi:hypothetical protein
MERSLGWLKSLLVGGGSLPELPRQEWPVVEKDCTASVVC